jgi:Spy/CpxP family protein refolding chaperone
MIGTFAIASYAQEATTTGKAITQSEGLAMRKGGRRHHRLPLLRLMQELNLTDAQKTQARTIVERFKTNIEPQRQALRELHKQREQGVVSDDIKQRATTLRGEIRSSMKGAHSELLTILTPEQRVQYDQMEQQWKTRTEERRARRSEHRKARTEQPPAQ